MADSFRNEFLDTVQDLCDIANGQQDADQIVWKAEYLTRSGRWYNYYGIIRNGQSSSIAHEFDARTGSTTPLGPDTCLFTLLDFSGNDLIAGYAGCRTAATDILEEVDATLLTSAEVVRVGLEARSRLPDGKTLMTVTDIAFLGFETGVVMSSRLIASRDSPSVKWCRGRHFFGQAPVLMQT